MKRRRSYGNTLSQFFASAREPPKPETSQLRPFDFNVIYDLNLTGRVKFGDLSEQTLYELFQDGRAASRLLGNLPL